MRRTIIAIIALQCLAAPATAQRAPSDNDIAEAIIRECSAIYHAGRPCACPEDTARNGSRCGRRSAYTRPGDAVPRCYVKDVTQEEIANYRNGKKDFIVDCEPTR
jgi:Ni/Co efflux regulator RcnB